MNAIEINHNNSNKSIVIIFIATSFHHKLHGSWIGNNSHVKLLFFISSYGIDMDVIHLFVLFEHRCHVHCLDMNVICLFVLFKHECCVSIHIVYTRKSYTWLSCLNNAWHSCVNDTNPWNNIFHPDFKRTHEAYKFVMLKDILRVQMSSNEPNLKSKC
jgi:hypothetical protein